MFAMILASSRSGNLLLGDASVPELILLTLVWLLFSLLLCGLAWVVYFLFSLPLRRLERARLFLDLMGAALKSGRNLEQTIVAISQTRESSVGVRFHLLAAHLEQGLRLFDALDKVPRLLPPHISAMLRVGQKTGDLSRVIPACRQALDGGASQIWGATNYLVVLMFVVLPAIPLVFGMIATVVFPKFRDIFLDMGVTTPPFTLWLFDHSTLLMLPILWPHRWYIWELCSMWVVRELRISSTDGSDLLIHGSSGVFPGNASGCSGISPPCWPFCSMRRFPKPKPSSWPPRARPIAAWNSGQKRPSKTFPGVPPSRKP